MRRRQTDVKCDAPQDPWQQDPRDEDVATLLAQLLDEIGLVLAVEAAFDELLGPQRRPRRRAASPDTLG
jgi:hypothetical protein